MEKNPLVLVLDDDQPIRELMVDVLAPLYCVYGAADVLEATELIQARPFALLIIDLQLPVVTGGEFINIIRSFPEYDVLPIVAISAHPCLLHQLDTQVLMVLQKPFNLAEFKGLVAAIIRASAHTRDVESPTTGKSTHPHSPRAWSYSNLIDACDGKMDLPALLAWSHTIRSRSAELRRDTRLLVETMHHLYARQQLLIQEIKSLVKPTVR